MIGNSRLKEVMSSVLSFQDKVRSKKKDSTNTKALCDRLLKEEYEELILSIREDKNCIVSSVKELADILYIMFGNIALMDIKVSELGVVFHSDYRKKEVDIEECMAEQEVSDTMLILNYGRLFWYVYELTKGVFMESPLKIYDFDFVFDKVLDATIKSNDSKFNKDGTGVFIDGKLIGRESDNYKPYYSFLPLRLSAFIKRSKINEEERKIAKVKFPKKFIHS